MAGLFRYGLIDRAVAEADARPLSPLVPEPVPYCGYFFVVMTLDESETPPEVLQKATDKTSGKVHHPTHFAFCAYPARHGKTGRAVFILNQNNTVFWNYVREEPLLHWPSDDDRRQQWALGD